MAIAPTTPPPVSELPQAPDSSTMSPSTDPSFDTVANNFVSAQVSIVPQYNDLGEWQEKTAQEVYDNAIEAELSANNSAGSAAESAESAIIAQNASKLLGEWSTLTGSVNIGETVINNGGKWQATVNIADVTASEPTLSNGDWLLINSSGKVVPIADTLTLNANVINQISATQSNPLPLAASVPSGWIISISVEDESAGIQTTHLISGSDTTTDKSGVNDGFIVKWSGGGFLNLKSDGISNWSKI